MQSNNTKEKCGFAEARIAALLLMIITGLFVSMVYKDLDTSEIDQVKIDELTQEILDLNGELGELEGRYHQLLEERGPDLPTTEQD